MQKLEHVTEAEFSEAREDLDRALAWLGSLPDILDRLATESSKIGRDAIRAEADELRASVYERISRARFALYRVQ